MDDKQYVDKIFYKYGISNLLNFCESKYYNAYIDRIIYDYRILDKRGFTVSKFTKSRSFLLKYIYIVIGAFLSSIRLLFYRTPQKNIEERNIIALPYSDLYIRFKRLQEIISYPIMIYYHPVFHLKNLFIHRKYFKENNQMVVIDAFNVSDVIYLIWRFTINYCKLKQCSNELNKYFGYDTHHIVGAYAFYLLYEKSFGRFVEKKLSNLNRKIWFLDYDLDYKYIIFNDVIKKKRINDVTVHIQHGSFFEYEGAYCNPVSDVTLCCSEREKKIISKFNLYKADIRILGAPLQTFNDNIVSVNKKNEYSEYDCLFLLTSTNLSERTNIMKTILENHNFKKFKTLIRFRPVSVNEDRLVLASYISGGDISENSSLQNDIKKSKVIISFSEDATFQSLREQKKTILVVSQAAYKNYVFTQLSDSVFVTNIDNYHNVNLDYLIENYTSCNYSKDKFVESNFGINSIDELKDNMNKILIEYGCGI